MKPNFWSNSTLYSLSFMFLFWTELEIKNYFKLAVYLNYKKKTIIILKILIIFYNFVYKISKFD